MGQLFYVQQNGFLNKGYLIPFEVIAHKTGEHNLVLADATNCDPSPLRAQLPATRFRAIAAKGDIEPAVQLAAESSGSVWRLRASRDVTPLRIQDRLDLRLEEAGFQRSEQGLLPYSTLDLMLLRATGETGPPSHHLQLIRFERDAR